MKKLSALLLSVFLILNLSNCAKKEETQETPAVSVDTLILKSGEIVEYADVTSHITSDTSNVAPKVSGTVKKVYVNIGQKVKAGDDILKIDDSDLITKLNQAEAAVALAKASRDMSAGGSFESNIVKLRSSVDSLNLQYEDALKNVDRLKALYETGAIAKADLEKAELGAEMLKNQLETAKQTLDLTENTIAGETNRLGNSQVEQAESATESIRDMIAYTSVKSPINGVVTSIDTAEGNTVSAGIPIVTVSDDENLKINLNVGENIIHSVKTGDSVYISTENSKPHEAEITHLSNIADNRTMMYPVEIKLDNSGTEFSGGMFVNVRFTLNSKTNVPVLPINSVMFDNDKAQVYIIKNNKAVKTEVTTGIQNEDKIEITSGVKIGDEIVVKGQEFITQDSEVKVVNRGV